MNPQIEIDEGIGARIENAIRILRKMISKIEEAQEFIEDENGRLQAYGGVLPSQREMHLVARMIDAIDESDYQAIVMVLRFAKYPHLDINEMI